MLVVHAALRRTARRDRARVPLEHPPHFDADPRQIAEEIRALAFDHTEIGESHGEARVRIDLARIRPIELAPRLRLGRSIELASAEEEYEELKAARRRAPHLVQGDGSKIGDAVARFLKELPPRGVLKPLVPFDAAARQKPRTLEGAGGLLDDEDATGLVDAADDRADPRAVGHGRYGFLVGVGTGVRDGGTNVGVAVGTGVRVGTGVGVGVGVGVGHGSGLVRFQV